MTKRGTDLPFALPATTPAARTRARRIDDALANAHPDAHCELNWGQPHELLFATILLKIYDVNQGLDFKGTVDNGGAIYVLRNFTRNIQTSNTKRSNRP